MVDAYLDPVVRAGQVASFKASTTVDRGDFEVGTGSWAATMVGGGEVDIEILCLQLRM